MFGENLIQTDLFHSDTQVGSPNEVNNKVNSEHTAENDTESRAPFAASSGLQTTSHGDRVSSAGREFANPSVMKPKMTFPAVESRRFSRQIYLSNERNPDREKSPMRDANMALT